MPAHSLYVETLAELGIIGLLLLVGTIGAILVTLARGARGPNRFVHAALFSAALAWAVHAAVDWDWEMPAVTAWVFVVGGVALAARASARTGPVMGSRARVPLAAALVVAAGTPALLMLSQAHLQRAADAFEQGNCVRASNEAVASIDVLVGCGPTAKIVGYCAISDGRAQDASPRCAKPFSRSPGAGSTTTGSRSPKAMRESTPAPS